MVVVQDLVARFRSEGVQETAQQLQSVGQEAQVAARALELTAQKLAQVQGGSVASALDQLRRTGAQPVASALEQARREMENTATAAARVVAPTQAAARAAADMGQGFEVSGTSILRFAGGIAGVGLGLSLAAGTARLLHDAVAGIVDSSLAWERSLVQVRGLYGGLAPQIIATAQAQTALPGVLGTQQGFAQAAINASYLTSRYGIRQTDITQMTTAAGRAAGVLGLTDPRQQIELQGRFLAFAEGGGTALRDIGIEGTPLSVARRLGYSNEAALQALTPSQLREAQLLIETEGANRLAATAGDPTSLLSRRSAVQQQLNQVRDQITRTLEGQAPITAVASGRLPYIVGAGYERGVPAPLQDRSKQLEDQLAALNNELGNATKGAADAAERLNKLGVEAGGTTARLLQFVGSLEDVTSIARSDVAAQAQGAVAGRARMAVPAFGVTQGERVAVATNTAYQAGYQNFVAELAQQEQGNAIRDELQRRIQTGPANQRAAASRALSFAVQADPIYQRVGTGNRAAALLDLQASETQARLEEITLRQRERGLQLMRETVDLRRLDVQQQQIGLAATMNVVRAQQSAQPALNTLSDAQYTVNNASVLARARLARQLQGKDVSGLPSIESLIQMNVQGQFAVAEAGPAALQGGRAVELAQRTATSAGLAQQLTGGQLQAAELANDLRNLGDLPSQTALELELVQNNRDQLAVQKELRDLQKDLVRILTGRQPSLTSGQGIDEIAARLAQAFFGDDASSGNIPLPDLPGNRRGPS
jgi:hypothetical protein